MHAHAPFADIGGGGKVVQYKGRCPVASFCQVFKFSLTALLLLSRVSGGSMAGMAMGLGLGGSRGLLIYIL